MSDLIKELEARKDDYFLVADVINAMANATNSAPDEVVKYLMGFDIDEHLTIFYMDEYYSFEPYCSWLEQVGNDANITYFKKADVMAFEPITKHGIFKDDSLYYINPLQKNLDDDYLTMDEVVTTLNSKVDMSCDYDKIRDLARKRKITPCFYFSGYVCPLLKDAQGELFISSSTSSNSQFKMMTGYFTYRLLVEKISSYGEYITLPDCEVGNEILIYRLLERQDDTNISYSNGLALFESKPHPFVSDNNRDKFSCIGFDEIRFSKRELDDYIASTQTTSDNHFIEHVKLVEGDKAKQLESLKTENDKLNARLNKASEIYRQNQSEIKELKAQLEKAAADITELKEQLSNKIDAPDSIDELKGIAKLNIEKPIFISSAKAIARYLWSLDKSEAIRTGDMVQQVKAIMIKVNYDLLPSEDETIRTWLAEVAPPHAKKSGRTPKNAPSEITLTMKK
ncbi:coiled-coil domain-containing protein [Psychrobacter maritimus]|uniref:coiled-coil domain-containing protein n=1 Tax=Psychrobacter maritimus TaxID=256325 RepID=UPI0039AFD81D